MKTGKKITWYLVFCMVFVISGCRKSKQFDANIDERAKFNTKDTVILVGKYIPPKTPDKLTFIMMHGLASVKEEWYGFAEKIRQNGYGYFAFDLRGHGESKKGNDNRVVDLKYFSPPGPGSDWEKMIDDVGKAVDFLIYEKGLSKNKIGIAGASLGANIAIIYASKHKFIPAVILLSPGMEYAGLKIENSVRKYKGRQIAIAASPGDAYAYESSIFIYNIARKNKCKARFFTGQGTQHGTQIFTGNFDNQVVDWVSNLQ